MRSCRGRPGSSGLWPASVKIYAMKIRIDIEDRVYRRAKREAARRGCSLDSLVVDGLKLVTQPRTKARVVVLASKPGRPRVTDLIKRRRILDQIVAANQRMGLYDD